MLKIQKNNGDNCMGEIISYKKKARYPRNNIISSRLNGVNATTIAFNYYCGKDGFPMDKNRAYQYFVIGANLGCPYASWIVGYFYLIGEVVEQDIKKGISILERECNKNNIIALAYMSKYYEYGHYVKVDKEKAVRYYLKIKLIGDMDREKGIDNSDYINASKKLYKFFYERKQYRKALFMLNGLERNLWIKCKTWIIKNKLDHERKLGYKNRAR